MVLVGSEVSTMLALAPSEWREGLGLLESAPVDQPLPEELRGFDKLWDMLRHVARMQALANSLEQAAMLLD
jgi:hypothetical protein